MSIILFDIYSEIILGLDLYEEYSEPIVPIAYEARRSSESFGEMNTVSNLIVL